ncbi:hypothetical protein GCM10029963_79890 [Micromonospora andamanensis]|uniref:hypothetical protein n=1 Tax=Micromonospora andamanensis TaxID=1287068 RepID=UPI001951819E|nr:hypothetical protein [Micromonospora andamanensis]GIJ40529.1 hypothetical protein Vwe01_38540 [Micromonospora andamanensis]
MAEQSAKAVRAETEKAALGLLRERANLVGEAATARHDRDQLAEALSAANSRYAESYAAAMDGGWTADDLAKLGLDAPESNTVRRRRPRRPASPSDSQHREDLVSDADTGGQG